MAKLLEYSPYSERVQILGATEISYIETLSPEEARHSVQSFFALNPACVVVTRYVAYCSLPSSPTPPGQLLPLQAV